MIVLICSERLDCKETGVFLRLRFALLGPTHTRAEEKRKFASAEKRKFPPTRTVLLIFLHAPFHLSYNTGTEHHQRSFSSTHRFI